MLKLRVGTCWATGGSAQYERGSKGKTESLMPADLAAYRAWVRSAVTRYSAKGVNAYAIENGPGRFDPENPRHLPKITFLMLMRDERLATVEARFDEATHCLTMLRAGKQVARGDLRTRLGCSMIEQFLAAYMKTSLRGAPRIVSAPGHSFSDVAMKCLHIVNWPQFATSSGCRPRARS
jgi:hypothetical protein